MKKHIIYFIRKLEENLFCRNNSLGWINIRYNLESLEIELQGLQRLHPGKENICEWKNWIWSY